ncbi:hypothetical protein AMR72_05520 [Flavobacterium psychrophilum]|nr:hypothetical protein AMR72_05520 [Flavobacterium psychrophilum]AOE52022.1 hypothetical protein ALW18_05515 [Flavobacterium psychrophilum]
MNEIVKKNGLNFGVILGIVSILITVIIYVTDPTKFVSIWVGLGIILMNLIFGIFVIAKTKQALGGFITFKEAFTVYFITMALASLISIIFMYLLFNFIDPSIKETIMVATTEMTVNMMKNMGVKTEEIRKTVEAMREVDNFSILKQLQSYLGGLLIHTIIGLIVAAVMKKNNPYPFTPSDEELNKVGSEQ